MLFSLQYLRGVASLLVVLYHARGELNGVYAQSNLGDLLFSNGYIGVDLFFMISGFVIMLSTAKDSSTLSFITKRLFRIYPIYFVCLMLSVYAFKKPLDTELFKALFFVNSDLNSPAPWFGYTIVYTAWTLMFEVLFYIIFAISMSISWRFRLQICSAIIIATVTSLNYLYNGGFKISGYDAIQVDSNASNIMLLARVLSSPMFYEFIIGMAIYWLYQNVRLTKIITMFSSKLLAISGAAFIFFIISGYNGGHGLFNCGLFAAFLLISLTIYEKCHCIKKNNSLNILGDISYSLYLIHPLVISGVVSISAYSRQHGISNLILIIFICIPISMLMFNLVEIKFVQLARVIISKFNKDEVSKIEYTSNKKAQ